MTEKQKVTKEGYSKIVREIEEREGITRKEIADEIDKARQQGDLSENAAYKAAIEAKEFNENKIEQLKEQLANSEIIEWNNLSTVGIGKKVELENSSNKNTVVYTIVGHNEADPIMRKISLDSPIGEAIVGKKVGDKVTVNTPSGEIVFTIKKIS